MHDTACMYILLQSMNNGFRNQTIEVACGFYVSYVSLLCIFYCIILFYRYQQRGIIFYVGGIWRHIVYAQRCWWGCILYAHDIWRQDTQCLPLRMRINTYTIVKAEYFYECESDDLCINMYTPYVVTERVKRCIAAKRENG